MLWASLLPIALILRPYNGLSQDARIYIGRAVADRDPTGVGLDTVFVHDGQNGFSVMARLVGVLLRVLTPEAASLGIACVGLLAWLAAAVALALCFARGRLAWLIVVALIALPSVYGGFGTFAYGETLATPRTLAEAAVLAGFAALLSGRTRLGLALILASATVHPLIALPGIAVAAILLVLSDRRWLLPIAAVAVAVAGAAMAGAPLFERLLRPLDPVWGAVLRQRSVNLFPSLWSGVVYIGVMRRLGTALVAATVLTGRIRGFVLAGCTVSMAGLAVAAVFGDAWMMELVVQLQTWRALWILAVLGNAGAAICAVRLWRERPVDRLALAALALAWLADDFPVLEGVATAVAIALRVAALRGWAPRVPPRLMAGTALLIVLFAAFELAQSVAVTAVLMRTAWVSNGDPVWHFALDADLPRIPLLAAALALACVPVERLLRFAADWPLAAPSGVVALVIGSIFALVCFDQTSNERGAALYPDATAALRGAIGSAPGDVMWIDEDDENWFLAGRPAFFNTLQGAPILFSRTLALDWAARAAAVRALGWTREIDVSPWTSPARRLDPILLSAGSLEAFCADPRRPAAVVAPGDQRGAAPRGWTAALWRPERPFYRLWIDDGVARRADWHVFTVVRCPAAVLGGPAAAG